MPKPIRTFADYDVADTPIGYESGNYPNDENTFPEGDIYIITEESAAKFEAHVGEDTYELDLDALREAEIDEAWLNLKL
jgi:hypothetical protein